MLRCYLDDSGTHDSSKVIVWAGIFGHEQYIKEFEDAWKATLRVPCERRPPIKRFHSFDLANSMNEFAGYNLAERDLTRFNFRKVIVDAGLTWLSFGVSVADWNKNASSYLRQGSGSAERLVFGKVIMTVCDSAHEHDEPVSFQFDKGREAHVSSIIQSALDESHIDKRLVSHGFSSVSESVGLQAADLVAHETYRFCERYANDGNAKPDAHLQRLQEGGHDARIGWFGRDEIQAMSNALDASLKDIEAKQEG
jgi:hypothetical protein